MKPLHAIVTEFDAIADAIRVGVAMTAGAIVSWMLALSVPPPDGVVYEGTAGLEVHAVMLGSLLSGIACAIVAPADKYEPIPLPAATR